ncbi:MAG: hypothetical protein M0D55_04690 [Elusimicrobiota bacterium]|nr:MAG: hypothetical protein M0D55_04690 [Elusimicrobiota bacterium]
MDELSARGIEHYNAGRFAEALRCFRAAGGPEARVFAAHVLDSAGRAEESAAEFAGAIEAFPLHLPAYEGLAKLIIRGAAPGGAAALRGILSAGASGSSGTLRLCARAFAACGDDAAAEKALRAALRRSPRDAESRALLADLLGAREKAALAELHRRALASVGAGRFAEAERTYRRALRLSPRDAEAAKGLDGVLRSRARSAASAGRLAAADALLREALARSPRDAELRGERALIAARRGDVRRALSFRPASGEVLLLCAEARLAGGREAEAEKLLRRVPAGDPAEAKARKRLAAILRARAIAHDVPNAPLRRERARRAWEEVVRADPEDGAARVSLSLLERWTGTAQGERAYLGEAVAPGRSLSRPERFMALMRLGRFAEAVGLAEAALDDGMTLADFRAFIDPWEKDNRPDRTAPQTDVAALDAALRDAPGPWRAFYLGSLGGRSSISTRCRPGTATAG